MATAKTADAFVKFTETRKVKAAGGDTFEKDRIYPMSKSSADHWISRGAAKTVTREDFLAQERADRAPPPKKETTENPTPAPGAPNPPSGGGGSQSNPAGKP